MVVDYVPCVYIAQNLINMYTGSPVDRYMKLQKILPVSYIFTSSKKAIAHACMHCLVSINVVMWMDDDACYSNTIILVYIIEIILRVIGHGPYEYFRKKKNL